MYTHTNEVIEEEDEDNIGLAINNGQKNKKPTNTDAKNSLSTT